MIFNNEIREISIICEDGNQISMEQDARSITVKDIMTKSAAATQQCSSAVIPGTEPRLLGSSARNFATEQELLAVADQSATPLTLEMMRAAAQVDAMARVSSAAFLKNELSVRMAKAVRALDHLPHGLCKAEGMRPVRDYYVQNLHVLDSITTPTNPLEEEKFTDALEGMKGDGSTIVPTIARAVAALKQTEPTLADHPHGIEAVQLSRALDEFLISRLGIRMLIGQQVESRTTKGGRIKKLCPRAVAEKAIAAAGTLCHANTGWTPKVDVIGEQVHTHTCW